MSLAPTAPWIIPPDYVGAMSRGAQLGLSARSEDQAEQSAADRLSLAYKQLAAENDRANKVAQGRQDLAAETLKYRNRLLDAQKGKSERIPRTIDLNGQTIFENSPGNFTQLHVPGVAPTSNKLSPAAEMAIKGNTSSIIENTRKMKLPSVASDQKAVDALVNMNATLHSRNVDIAAGRIDPVTFEPVGGSPAAGTNAPAAESLQSPATDKPRQEVVRKTKDGRRAIFDADTKEFIRYAE